MASSLLTTVTVLMLLALSIHRVHCAHHSPAAAAPSPAASSGVDCSSLVLNMADCLTFVTAGSTVSKPEGSCCSGLKTVLKTDAECLCEAFKNSAALGVDLNVTKAMTLPSLCKVSTPSAAKCDLSLSPVGAPSSGGDATPPTVSSTGGGVNDQAPALAPAPGSLSSHALAISVSYVLMGLLVVSSLCIV